MRREQPTNKNHRIWLNVDEYRSVMHVLGLHIVIVVRIKTKSIFSIEAYAVKLKTASIQLNVKVISEGSIYSKNKFFVKCIAATRGNIIHFM